MTKILIVDKKKQQHIVDQNKMHIVDKYYILLTKIHIVDKKYTLTKIRLC